MSFKKTEIGYFPNTWKIDTMENALESIIDYRGKTPEKAETGILTLSARSVKNGYIDYSNAYCISPSEYRKFMVRGKPRIGDILMTTEAPIGCIAKLDRDDIGLAQRLLTLRGEEGYVGNDYLMYYLISKVGQHQLNSRSSGTTVTGIKQSEFRKTLIVIPPIHEQKVISGTLSCLDKKIELNKRINDNLAKQGKSMFYKLMNEDFGITKEIGQLSDIAYINQLYKLKKGQVSTYVEMSNLPTKGSFPTAWEERAYNSGAKFMNGDTIMARISPCLENGKTAFISFLQKEVVGWGSTEYIVLSPKHPAYSEFLYFLARDKDFVRYAIMNMSGTSGRQRVSGDVIGKYGIVLPPIEKVESFSLYATTIMKTIYENCIQNIVLGKLRDALLPKLMSGEIDVSQISN